MSFSHVTLLLYDIMSNSLINVTNRSISIMEKVMVNEVNSEHLPATPGFSSKIGEVKQKLKDWKDDKISEARAAHDVANEYADNMFANSSGNFQMLTSIAKSLVVFGIMIGLGILILVKFRDSTEANSTAYNEINEIIALFTDLRTWGGIVLIVIVGYVILRYLGVFDKEA